MLYFISYTLYLLNTAILFLHIVIPLLQRLLFFPLFLCFNIWIEGVMCQTDIKPLLDTILDCKENLKKLMKVSFKVK